MLCYKKYAISNIEYICNNNIDAYIQACYREKKLSILMKSTEIMFFHNSLIHSYLKVQHTYSREKFDYANEKETRKSGLHSVGHNNSRDSAIDADLQEFEMETIDVELVRARVFCIGAWKWIRIDQNIFFCIRSGYRLSNEALFKWLF